MLLVVLTAHGVADADVRDYIYVGGRLVTVAGPIGISIDDVQIDEGNSGTTPAVFTVRLSAPTNQVVTANFATAPNTAAADVDYVSRSRFRKPSGGR
jgi:hypothetical protein